MSAVYFGVLQLLLLVLAKGENCKTLEGTWYDEYGSQLELVESADGTLTGRYKSSGHAFGFKSASDAWHPLIGHANDSIFGFNIEIYDGDLVKSWTGQGMMCKGDAKPKECVICDNNEVLLTTWLTRKRVLHPDEFVNTFIGSTTFKRNSPRKYGVFAATQERELLRTKLTFPPRPTTKCADPAGTPERCSLNGKWQNELGSNMTITQDASGAFTGFYQTAVGEAVDKNKIFGLAAPNQPYGVFAWHVIWHNKDDIVISITGWVGQCHWDAVEKMEILLTSWVLRKKIPTCKENWESTYFGQDFFYRIPDNC